MQVNFVARRSDAGNGNNGEGLNKDDYPVTNILYASSRLSLSQPHSGRLQPQILCYYFRGRRYLQFK
jgi:hypothetical protein